MTRKKKVFLDSKTQDFIVEKMTEGMDIATISHTYPTKVPAKEHIYSASAKGDEFSHRVNEAYGVLMMNRLDEFHKLASTPAALLYPASKDPVTGENIKVQFREYEAHKKHLMIEAQFTLAKMAPILAKRFRVAQDVNIQGQLDNQITVINYSTLLSQDTKPELISTDVNPITPSPMDE